MRPTTPRFAAYWIGSHTDPAIAFDVFTSTAPTAFWLDGGSARPSYIGHGTPIDLDPDQLASIRWHLDHLGQLNHVDTDTGIALVGWLSYDLATESTGVTVESDPAQRTRFMVVSEALSIAPSGQTHLLVHPQTAPGYARNKVAKLRTRLRQTSSSASRSQCADRMVPLSAHWYDSDTDYQSMIATCQAHIREGDAYQLCLTTRIRVDGTLDKLSAYMRLRQSIGTSRGGIIRFGDTWLLSASPEQFLAVNTAGTVSTSPIKGTRRRGSTEAEDRQLHHDLQTSVKERAENVMIVDLMRNDLHRICSPGTVTVTRLLEIDTHPQVHQLVSTVEGKLSPESDIVDVLTACFPAGSMTGAPKVSAIQILDRIESSPRGAYAGAFGYITYDGASEFSMTIRSIVAQKNSLTIGTGGGITALSNPAEEIDEIHLKARALLAAMELS